MLRLHTDGQFHSAACEDLLECLSDSSLEDRNDRGVKSLRPFKAITFHVGFFSPDGEREREHTGVRDY